MSEYPGAFGDDNDRKAPCPTCEGERRVNTLFEKIDRWHDDGPDIQGVDEYYVFECRGCETTFFARSKGNSEDYFEYQDPVSREWERDYLNRKTFWPSVPTSTPPSWSGFNLRSADETLHDLLSSIYKAANEDMPVLAAIGTRTAFDRVSELLDVEPEKPFSDKLEQLRKKGAISGSQKGILAILIDAGSAAAHRGWKPSPEELSTMIEILEALIRDHFVLKDAAKKLREKAPEKRPDFEPSGN